MTNLIYAGWCEPGDAIEETSRRLVSDRIAFSRTGHYPHQVVMDPWDGLCLTEPVGVAMSQGTSAHPGAFEGPCQDDRGMPSQGKTSSGPKNITLVVNHLLYGGAARVAAHLTNSWADMGRNVTILTTVGGWDPSTYALHPKIVHLPLNLSGMSGNPLEAVGRNVRRLVLLRRAIRATRPDLLVSFLDSNNVMSLLATRGLSPIPVIISERTDPHGRPIGRSWEWLRGLTYPWADCLVTQSRHAMDYFPADVQAKGRIIPNPVPLPPGTDSSPITKLRSQVITLGRLHKVKGHDLLIKAFARIANDFPSWDLCVHGEGPERDSLQAMICAHKLESRITLGPAIVDVWSRLREAQLFVLPSRAEGFPNGLAEAMACGLPVISFDCASGPSELIRQGLDGLLVPPEDVPALAKAMARLMADSIERAVLGARATEVLIRFSPSRVMEQWESAVQSAMQSRGSKQP